MKKAIYFFLAAIVIASCQGNKKQGSETHSAVPSRNNAAVENKSEDGECLKGIVMPIDTVLFRYAYRIRVCGDRAVVHDLHNKDYWYHVFTYPDFHYLSSFGKLGQGPQEITVGENMRFDSKGRIFAIDSNKNRLFCFSHISDSPRFEGSTPLDKGLMWALDFDFYGDNQLLIPDYTGKKRFCWVSRDGHILRKMETIPMKDRKKLQESTTAAAQGWRSFVMFSPSRKELVAVTQLGEVLDIYNLTTGKHYHIVGPDGEPQYQTTPEGYGIPVGAMGYTDLQVTDKYIYTVYQGTTFKDIMKDTTLKQGGNRFRIYNLQGKLLKEIRLDHFVLGLHVDESRHVFFATDVNADQQIVRYPLPDPFPSGTKS